MAEDMFGDSSLFDEFEKERESSGSFILYKVNDEGEEDKSRILFRMGDSEESESSSDDDSGESENENNGVDQLDDAEEKHEETSIQVDGSDIVNGGSYHIKNRQSADRNTEYKLTHERNKFERYARVIDSTRFTADSNSPACQIIYQNNDFSRKYRTSIEQYIMHLINREEQSKRERLPDIQLKLHSDCFRAQILTCLDLNSKLTGKQRTMKMWTSHAIIGSSQFHRDFVIDPLGWPLVSNNPSLTDSWEAPKYEQVYTDPLPLAEEELDTSASKPPRQKQTCFNCCGEHMIADCPEPKDFTRIRQNRDKFRQDSVSQKPTSKRYHLDKSFQSESNSFVPGVISEELMDALGITSRYLPSYIYKMRVLGYPPGWLEEAKVQSSGLVLFDGEGNEVDASGKSMEDGEVSDSVPNKGQIDPEKIIAYPGFTVAVPPDTIDEYEELGAPPLQDHQLKSTLTAQLSGMKRKIEEVEEESRKKRRKREKASLEEMDLSDGEDAKNRSIDNDCFVPPLPMDTPPSKPPPPDSTPPVTPDTVKPKRLPLTGEPPLPLNTPPGKPPIPKETPPPTPEGMTPAKHVSEDREKSPSLEDLEQQYQLLQEKLCEDDGDKEVELQVIDSCGPEDDGSATSKDQLSKSSSVESGSSSQDLSRSQMSRMGSTASITSFGELGRGSPTSSLPGTPLVEQSSNFTELNFTFKSTTGSISRDFGTPIQKRQGVASDLPDADKFGEGIMDHIPYENLPEATGTFEKMRGLIDRIRTKVSLRKKKKS
ncbi:zinc finger CCHC domain-containing protein 8-like [Pecten maximus]|uniref:zinc finger CCHC domain-containing protein 8-like n=1 Tax=Pecten maximus TaxID=6579 RepID=UPI00145860DF|nr:zinc finger CCHC domain-containing protein 8-like [Pecten maximus]